MALANISTPPKNSEKNKSISSEFIALDRVEQIELFNAFHTLLGKNLQRIASTKIGASSILSKEQIPKVEFWTDAKREIFKEIGDFSKRKLDICKITYEYRRAELLEAGKLLNLESFVQEANKIYMPIGFFDENLDVSLQNIEELLKKYKKKSKSFELNYMNHVNALDEQYNSRDDYQSDEYGSDEYGSDEDGPSQIINTFKQQLAAKLEQPYNTQTQEVRKKMPTHNRRLSLQL